ncbi:hypothetical protein GCM10018966_075870 [Streptomyces yanii]
MHGPAGAPRLTGRMPARTRTHIQFPDLSAIAPTEPVAAAPDRGRPRACTADRRSHTLPADLHTLPLRRGAVLPGHWPCAGLQSGDETNLKTALASAAYLGTVTAAALLILIRLRS